MPVQPGGSSSSFTYTLGLVASCETDGGRIVATLTRTGSGTPSAYGFTAYCYDAATLDLVDSAAINPNGSATFSALVNSQYLVEVEELDGSGTGSAGGGYIAGDSADVLCGVLAPLVVTVAQVDAPSVRGALGNVRLAIAGARAQVTTTLRTQPGGVLVGTVGPAASAVAQFNALAEGLYTATTVETGGRTTVLAGVEVPLGPLPVVPPDPGPFWLPVGGVLPNPALLPCPVTSLEKLVAGVASPRVNLHIELELFRLGEATPFARARQTVRRLAEVVDVARYLRPQLAARLGYGVRIPGAIDNDASVTFRYRYREVDADGASPWAERNTPRYGVLMALPDEFDDPAAYLASTATPGVFTTLFDEVTQFVGLPLEVGILLPARPPGLILFGEVTYYDAADDVLERRSVEILDDVPAGYLRLALPDDPLPCAVRAEVALVDTDRAFIGVCPALPPGSVTPSAPVVVPYLDIQPGRLKL